MKLRFWTVTAVFAVLAAAFLIPAQSSAKDGRFRVRSYDGDGVVVHANGRTYHLDEEDFDDLAEALESLEIYFDEDLALELEEALDDAMEALDSEALEDMIESSLAGVNAMFEDGDFMEEINEAIEEAMESIEDLDFGDVDVYWDDDDRHVRRHRHVERRRDRHSARIQRDTQRWARDLERRLSRLDANDMTQRINRDVQRQIQRAMRNVERHGQRTGRRAWRGDGKDALEERLEDLRREMEDLERRLEEMSDDQKVDGDI